MAKRKKPICGIIFSISSLYAEKSKKRSEDILFNAIIEYFLFFIGLIIRVIRNLELTIPGTIDWYCQRVFLDLLFIALNAVLKQAFVLREIKQCLCNSVDNFMWEIGVLIYWKLLIA